MPELPEVETIVRDIRPALLGRRLDRVSLSHDDVLRGVSRRRLLQGLRGSTVRDVFRRAKHAVIDLGERRLVVQPGMTGSLIIHDRALARDQRRYAVLRAAFPDPTTPIETEAFRAVVAEELTKPDPPPWPLPLDSVDEILLLMSWFRAHPDALRHTKPLGDWV